MTGRYILVDGRPVPEPDLMAWGAWFENMDNRRIAAKQVGILWVSTVFLALDHAFLGGPPILFETMVFAGGHSISEDRYCDLEEAQRGHERCCRWAATPNVQLGAIPLVLRHLPSDLRKNWPAEGHAWRSRLRALRMALGQWIDNLFGGREETPGG